MPAKARRLVLQLFALQCATSIASARSAASTPKRLGYLAFDNAAASAEYDELLLDAMRRLGWMEGRNYVIKRASANFKPERLPALAAELVDSGVDVILTSGAQTTLVAARATRKIPIVFASSLPFALQQGLIDSYAHPGHNVTGAVGLDVDVVHKRIQYLREIAPNARRLAWFYPHGFFTVEHLSGAIIEITPGLEKAALKLGFETRWFPVRAGQDIGPLLEDSLRWGAQALAGSVGDASSDRRLIDFAVQQRLPLAVPVREYVEAGALLSYTVQGPSDRLYADLSAKYLDRILRGAQPSDLPVEFPTQFELVVNMKTAQALGLSVPPSLSVSAELLR
jgi:putative tryptophan/tyrosine transport system substrate-binding protein